LNKYLSFFLEKYLSSFAFVQTELSHTSCPRRACGPEVGNQTHGGYSRWPPTGKGIYFYLASKQIGHESVAPGVHLLLTMGRAAEGEAYTVEHVAERRWYHLVT
jgi:hypothetical protein